MSHSWYMLLSFNSEFHCGTKLTVHKIYISKPFLWNNRNSVTIYLVSNKSLMCFWVYENWLLKMYYLCINQKMEWTKPVDKKEVFSFLGINVVHSVHPLPLSAGTGGWASYQVFEKGGGLTGSQFWEGGCWERGGDFFGRHGRGGGGCSFAMKKIWNI